MGAAPNAKKLVPFVKSSGGSMELLNDYLKLGYTFKYNPE